MVSTSQAGKDREMAKAKRKRSAARQATARKGPTSKASRAARPARKRVAKKASPRKAGRKSPARGTTRTSSRPAAAAARKTRTPARKTTTKASAAARKAAKRATRKSAARTAAPPRKSASGRKTTLAGKTAARKPAAARKAVARKATPARTPPRGKAAATTRKTAAATAPAPRRTAPRLAPAPRPVAGSPAHRLSLERDRRRLPETDTSTTPPSSLDLDRRASAARSGLAETKEALQEHTESSPALTGGDVDASWQTAYAVGDEAPGGDNPTPDQDVVEEIGRSLGLVYEDNEELKGVSKIEERDKHRWELDPASSEDYEDRD